MRSIDRLSVLQTVADALGVLVAELRGEEADDSTTAELPEAFGSLRFAPTGHPALDVVLGTDLQAITNERLDQLRNLHAQPLAMPAGTASWHR